MAIVTRTIGAAVEAAGTATLQVDYDDARLRLTAVRIVNGHPALTARLTATSVADPARTYTLDGPPGQTTTQGIPTGQSTRLDVTIDARGRVDGVDYTFRWLA